MSGIDSTNPSIPLSVATPPAPNLLATIAAVNQIKSSQLNQQLVQQEIQKQNADQQIQQQALAGLKATNAAVQGSVDPATGLPDFDRASQALYKGGFAKEAQALQQRSMEFKKSNLEYSNLQLSHDHGLATAIGEHLNGVTDQPGYTAALASMGSVGIPTDKMPPVYDPAYVQQKQQQSLSVKDAVDQKREALVQSSKSALEASQTANNEAELPAKQAAATQATKGQIANKLLATATNGQDYAQVLRTEDPTGAMGFPAQFDRKGIIKAALTPEQLQAADAKDIELRQGQEGKNLEAQRVGIERARLSVEQLNAGIGPDGKPIQYTDPVTGQAQNISPIAQAIASYKLPPAGARSYTSNRGLMNQVMAANPGFDIAQYGTRQNVAKDFANDKPNSAGGQVLALNTLVHHAQLYQDVASSLKNNTFTPGNAVYNSVAQAFGQSPPTSTNLVAQFLAGETAKAAGGSQAEGEINRILGSLSKNASPQQIADTGKTILQIAAGRMTPLKEKADQSNLGSVVKVIGPDAAAILQKNGYDPTTLKQTGTDTNSGGGQIAVPAPNGKTYHFVTKEQADAFKKSAGIQ